MSTKLQTSIQSALQALPSSNFRAGHLALLKTLGYASDKSMPIPEEDNGVHASLADLIQYAG